MNKKQARAECRKLAIQHNCGWWQLCWDKQKGYYPAADSNRGLGIETNMICWVDKSGVYMYATKENEKLHQLKGNIRKQ